MSSQWKGFWDMTVNIWKDKHLMLKPCSLFFATATQGGGQETTGLTFITHLVHHGMVYVPLGLSHPSTQLNFNCIHAGSCYGSGTYSDLDGKRLPNNIEKRQSIFQGRYFTAFLQKLS
mmetsp:Transcript_107960/g.131724  ORF Transcript_107960/g.131724 Transcript_107960/m.131724 type:complete len:118 (-) Transcript_107960:71-424(-)